MPFRRCVEMGSVRRDYLFRELHNKLDLYV